MAYGDCRDDETLRAAWKQFCRRLEDAGDKVFKEHNPATPANRADGVRYLMQNLGQVWDLAFEKNDPKYPFIHEFVSPFCKLGGDNADGVYQHCWIDGQSVYRISGNVGTASFLNFLVHGPRPEMQPARPDWPSLHDPFGDFPETNLFGHQLETEWDGSFELYVGGEKRGRNWLPTTPQSRKLFIRQAFDRFNEIPARYRIERIDMAEPRPLPTPERMIAALDWSATFMQGIMSDYPEYAYDYTPGQYIKFINRFPPLDADDLHPGKDSQRGRAAATMTWRLASDEAMIIEIEEHDGFWMISNMGPFMNSMDFLYRPVSYTPSRTQVDSDGKVRIIMCHEDPGYSNWLDTQGFVSGNITYRNFLNESRATIRTQVMKRSELASALPADVAMATAEDRFRQMWERFNGIRQRFVL
jgi:hypothetical protein